MRISADEAAARLGIKKASLYAYVSRGVLQRERHEDGRRSTFDSAEVDRLARERKPARQGEVTATIATGVARVSDAGLLLRDVDIATIVDWTFERVAEHLWGLDPGPWPTADEIPLSLSRTLATLPAASSATDRLPIAVTLLGALDPLRHDQQRAGVIRAAKSMITGMVEALEPGDPAPTTAGLARRLWPRLSPRRPTARRVRALEAHMNAVADHGIAASTFAARIAASTRADPYAIISAAMGVLSGPYHGGAGGEVHRLLVEAEATDPATALGALFRRGERVPGYGHTVYSGADPRFAVLDRIIADTWSDDPRLGIVTELRRLADERLSVAANVDQAFGAFTYLADMKAEASEVIFTIGRTAGWIAHALEEYDERPVRFRPKARYVRPAR